MINHDSARLGTIMRLSQADPVQRHVMSCAQFSAVSLLAKPPLGGKEQEGTARIILLEFKRSQGARENTGMCTPSTENGIY